MALETIFKLGVVLTMIDKLSGPTRIASTNVANLQRRMDSLKNTSENWMKTGAGMTVAGAGIAQGMLMPITATHATKKALGELSAVGVKDLAGLENAATDFSNKWSGTMKSEFISAAYDIKGGIASLSDEGVAEYTKLAALTGKATKATTAEMTSLFATGYGIYKDYYKNLSDIKFGEMFAGGLTAAVNYFKSTGPQMAQAMTALGAAATSANRPLEEQLTVLGMLQATMPGGEAGTKYRAFIQSAAKAGSELGISFVDSKNQLLSVTEILQRLKGKYGDTLDAIEKQQIQKAFGTDEAVAMIDLLYPKVTQLGDNIKSVRDSMKTGTALTEEMAEAMNKDPAARWQIVAQRFQNLKEVVGNQLLPVVEPAVARLEKFVSRVAELAGKNPDATRAIGLMVMGLSALLIVVGASLTALGFLMNMVSKGIQVYTGYQKAVLWVKDAFLTLKIHSLYAMDSLRSGWTKVNQGATTAYNATRRVSTAVVDIGRRAAIAAATGLKNLVTSMANLSRTAGTAAVAALRNMATGLASMAVQAYRTAVTALPGLIAGVWSFTAALLANPVTWVVVGIIALVAAVILLWRNWDKVSAVFRMGWAKIRGAFSSGVAYVRNLFSQMMGFLQKYGLYILVVLAPFLGLPLLIIQKWGDIKSFFINLWTDIVGWIQVKISEFRQSGTALIDAFVQGIQSVISKPYEVVQEGLAKLRQLLPFSDAKEGPLSRLTRSGRAVLETFSGGMKERLGLPGKVMAGALSGMSLKTPITMQPAFAGLPQGITASLPGAGDFSAMEIPSPTVAGRESRLERFNLREVLRESRFVREKETIRDTRSRPVVVVVNGGQGGGNSVEDYVELAYRYFSMRGE
ncbi:phage tail tape measure protein [Pelotomaculum propionicicum]|uniref:Phage tail tape measure protein domain-containing protein n=1 Tax=Pelotomaculum propionicicum TaxID=258475 RepID=A0A4Y7RLE8_9FIRM|nr:phage tail tape measure protein [Pelotomaculum propionicicum]TEB09137.1 hypothetical protein Pmgp_03358 [Pelotomaculum propionicicum]